MGVQVLIVACGLLALLIIILYRQSERARRVRLQVRKLYATPMFDELLPLLVTAKKHPLEQITVDKTGVKIKLLYQANEEQSFNMLEHGYPYLTRERQDAMRIVLEECVPKLTDSKRYNVALSRVRLINGEVEYSYSYIMKNAYKNKLVRAPYYDASLKARLW